MTSDIHNPGKDRNSKVDEALLNQTIKRGIVERASNLSFFLAASYLAHGFTNTKYIQLFDASATLTSNLFPRLIFNVLPSIALGIALKSSRFDLSFRAWIWCCLTPIIYLGACFTYIWPIMYQGDSEIFLYEHAASVIFIDICTMWVSPFPKQLLTFLISMIGLVYLPAGYLLSHGKSPHVFSLFIDDTVLFMFLAFFGGYIGFQVRKKLAREVIISARAFRELETSTAIEQRQSKQIALFQKEKADALTIRGKQVYHDIKNPLEALRMRLEATAMNQVTRTGVLNDIQRIDSILDALVRTKTKSEVLTKQHLPSLISSIVSEFEVRLQDSRIEIKYNHLESAYLPFSDVIKSDFLRALSNIIQNSVEAVSEMGKITVSLQSTDQYVYIQIEDNGKGIPAHVLPQIFSNEFSYEKDSTGQQRGLGLSQAKAAIESFGGSIEVVSPLNQGTKTTVKLRRVAQPSWFLDSLSVKSDDILVIIDNQQDTHDTWSKKLIQFNRRNLVSVSAHHFYSLKEFELWFQKNQTLETYLRTYLIVSQEEIASDNNALSELNSRNRFENRTILINQDWSDAESQKIYQKSELSLILRSIMKDLPLILKPQQPVKYDFVVIDDDISLLLSITEKASKLGKSILTFGNVGEFLREARFIHLDTEIRIDSDLGAEVTGEIESKKIFELGFHKIFLSSFREEFDLTTYPWLKGRLDKYEKEKI